MLCWLANLVFVSLLLNEKNKKRWKKIRNKKFLPINVPINHFPSSFKADFFRST